jgi:hypothetical protein
MSPEEVVRKFYRISDGLLGSTRHALIGNLPT